VRGSKSKLTTVLLLALLVATGCLNFGQEDVNVQGVVNVDGLAVDFETLQVEAQGTEHKAKVTSNGTFQIVLPSPGTYTLRVANTSGIIGIPQRIALSKGKDVSGVELEVISRPPTPLTLDLENPEHTALIEKTYEPLDTEITTDPFGDTAILFGPGSTDQRPADTYDPLRFFILDYPHTEGFDLRLKSLGHADARDGNRTLTVIFGFQDMQNWWMFHLTNASTSRVAQIADGDQVDRVCYPKVEDLWIADSSKYQELRLTLEREGSEMVLNAWVDGDELTPLMDCRFPADQYTPGKIGLGGSSGSTHQSWYYKDITFDTL